MIGMLLMLMVVMAVGLSLLVAIPLLLLKVGLTLLFLPFRILAGVFRVVIGLFAGIAGVVAGGFGIVLAAGAVLLGVVLLPLLPFLLVGAVLYALSCAMRRPTAVRVVS